MVPNVWVPMESPLGPLAPHHLSEVVVGIVLMLIIWLVLAKKVVPAFEEMYHKRLDAIQGGMERAEKAQADAEAALSEYKTQLAEAREESARIREDAKNQGASILAEMRDQATRESTRIVENARAQIEAERTQVIGHLKSEIGGLATTLAGRIVGESLDDDARARATVDRFLEELESGSMQAAREQ